MRIRRRRDLPNCKRSRAAISMAWCCGRRLSIAPSSKVTVIIRRVAISAKPKSTAPETKSLLLIPIFSRTGTWQWFLKVYSESLDFYVKNPRQYRDGRCRARGGRWLHDPVRLIERRGEPEPVQENSFRREEGSHPDYQGGSLPELLAGQSRFSGQNDEGVDRLDEGQPRQAQCCFPGDRHDAIALDRTPQAGTWGQLRHCSLCWRR